jgi:hypothetical protein
VPPGPVRQVVISGQKYINFALFGADQVQRVECAETKPFESHGAFARGRVGNGSLVCESK